MVRKYISGEINMYKCKVLLNRLTTTIQVKIDNKIYTMYYHNGTLTNK